MNSPDGKPKRREFVRPLLEFVFSLRNTRGEVLDGWICSADGFRTDPAKFYERVEAELNNQGFPHVTIEPIEFAEGGLLSNQRIYLRSLRERFAVDTCAAPFGKHFFFSCRFVHIPILVRLWHLAAAFLGFGLVGMLLLNLLGLTFAVIAWVALLFAVVGVLRNAGAFTDLDTLLLRIPVVSPIYENWFRVETYYRTDTRTLYKTLVPDLVRKIAEDMCAADGVKLTPQDPSAPLFKSLS